MADVCLNKIFEVISKSDVEDAIIIDRKTFDEVSFSLVIDDRFPKFGIFLAAFPFPLCFGPRISQFQHSYFIPGICLKLGSVYLWYQDMYKGIGMSWNQVQSLPIDVETIISAAAAWSI